MSKSSALIKGNPDIEHTPRLEDVRQLLAEALQEAKSEEEATQLIRKRVTQGILKDHPTSGAMIFWHPDNTRSAILSYFSKQGALMRAGVDDIKPLEG